MPLTKMYENRAILIDPNEYANGWEHPLLHINFVTAAIEECHNFLPPDWYVLGYDEPNKTIVVGLKRYENRMNLAPWWSFVITADPLDNDEDQWIVFDVVRFEPSKIYNFQLP